MIAQTYHDSGWPRLIDNAAGIWSQIAFVPQPQRVRFPLLFQAAENEYLAMVVSHTALRQSGMPSDLFVFPDEDRKSVVSGKSVSVRVDLGCRRITKTKKN